jgi:hypothetical protein
MKQICNRSRSGAIVVALLAVGCVARPSDFAGVTKSRLHLLGLLGKSALEKQKPLNGVASIGDFLDVVKVEAEGRFEDDEADEWGRPFLVASSTSKAPRGIGHVFLWRDVHDDKLARKSGGVPELRHAAQKRLTLPAVQDNHGGQEQGDTHR